MGWMGWKQLKPKKTEKPVQAEKEEPKGEKEETEGKTEETREEKPEEQEEKPERDLQVLEFINKLQEDTEIIESLIQMKSYKDIDIVLVVPDGKEKITRIRIESDLYINRKLNIDLVNVVREKLVFITKSGISYELRVIGETEYKEYFSKKERQGQEDV